MKFVRIFEPYLYSVIYDDESLDKYSDLFDKWTDLQFVAEFVGRYENSINYGIFKISNKFEAVDAIIDEAYDFETYLLELSENAQNGLKPDFNSIFEPLDGPFKDIYEYTPMKSYGSDKPSFLRMYAIKIDDCFVVVDGGIKLAKKIQDSPDLKDHVISNIIKARKYLKECGIFDSDDLDNLIDYDDED